MAVGFFDKVTFERVAGVKAGRPSVDHRGQVGQDTAWRIHGGF